MNSYRIEKVRLGVTVVFAGGDRRSGEIFLSPTSRFGGDQQGPMEFLNDGDAYFALAAPDGPAVLIAKTSVESIEVPGTDGGIPGLQPQAVEIELRLSSGSLVSGTVFIDTPASHARLIDFLNSRREQFLSVIGPDRITLVNRHMIAHVQELI